ncbi:hypothetical protein [Nostoc sp.]|uniref:hypothetical protein n=1 Tax=Nostoc sp. TaxID=1180 RepID=UPI002FFB75C5
MLKRNYERECVPEALLRITNYELREAVLDVFVKMSRYLGANFKGIVKDLVPFWQVSTQNMGY